MKLDAATKQKQLPIPPALDLEPPALVEVEPEPIAATNDEAPMMASPIVELPHTKEAREAKEAIL